MAPGGRTLLQIGAFKAFADRPLNVRIGALLRLEVLASNPPRSGEPVVVVRLQDSTQAIRLSLVDTPLRLSDLPHRAAGATSTDMPLSPQLRQVFPDAGWRWALASSRFLAPLIFLKHAYDHNRRQPMAKRGAIARTEPMACASPKRQIDIWPGADLETQACAGDEALRFRLASDRYGRVMLRFDGHADDDRRPPKDQRGVLRTSLMIDLEKLGPVAIELQMGDTHLQVHFAVSSPTVAAKIEKRLCDVQTALGKLVRWVACRISTDAPLATANSENPSRCFEGAIDLKI
jgi:hypothetical protein